MINMTEILEKNWIELKGAVGKMPLIEQQIDCQIGENVLLKGCKRELQIKLLKKEERIEIRMRGIKVNTLNLQLTGHILLMNGSEGKVCHHLHLFPQVLYPNQLVPTEEKTTLTEGVGVLGIFKGHLPGVMRKKGGSQRRMLRHFRMMENIEERRISVIESVKIGMFYQIR